MTDVLLIQPPIEDFYLTKKRTLPYGLAAIAGHLKQNGHGVEIFDALATSKVKKIDWPVEFQYLQPYFGRSDLTAFSLFHEFKHFGYSFEHIGTIARDKRPRLVGISSLFTPYSAAALKTAVTIKKFWPDCKIVMGGHHPTQMPEHVMTCKSVDYIIRGEGEESMVMLADSVLNQTDPGSIPGIVFRKKNRSLHISPPVWLNDLNHHPLPAFELIDHHFYQRSKKGAAITVSSRGCPMKCSYCAVSSAVESAPYRRRDVDDVIKELDTVINPFDIGFIDFEDENLCLKKSWFLSLTDRIQQTWPDRIIEFRAMNGLYPPSIDADIVTAMKYVGFRTLNLSLGSSSPRQLAEFDRTNICKEFDTALSLARDNGLDCVSYIIAGAPGQDPYDSVQDLVYLAARPTLAGLSVFYPAPGSKDFTTCDSLGLLPESYDLMRSAAFPISHTTNRDQAVTLLRLSRILNFMKSLDKGQVTLPAPEKYTQPIIDPATDRSEISFQTLKWFLFDGTIRGVEKNGRVYEHQCDRDLTRQFLKNIRVTGIMGTKPAG